MRIHFSSHVPALVSYPLSTDHTAVKYYPKMVRKGETSATADGSVAVRALSHSVGQPRCPDFLAPKLLGPSWQKALFTLGRCFPSMFRSVWRAYHSRLPGIIEAHLTRTLFYDQAVGEALGGGDGKLACEQYVILGAGMDSRAYRFSELIKSNKVKVFEVDFHATQAGKQKRLRRARIDNTHVTYVACDFLREKFVNKLAACGFDTNKKTVITWEGVTMYLNEAVVRETCEFAATLPTGSTLLYDYVLPVFYENPGSLPGAVKHNKYVLKSGEPYTFGHEFSEYPAFVESCGLRVKQNVTAAELDRMYLSSEQDKHLPKERHVTPWYGIAQAVV